MTNEIQAGLARLERLSAYWERQAFQAYVAGDRRAAGEARAEHTFCEAMASMIREGKATINPETGDAVIL